MPSPEDPRNNFRQVLWETLATLIEVGGDALATALYLGGVLFIELIIKPWLGQHITFFVNAFLLITQVALTLSMLRRLWRMFDLLFQDVTESHIGSSLRNAWTRRRNLRDRRGSSPHAQPDLDKASHPSLPEQQEEPPVPQPPRSEQPVNRKRDNHEN
jgi:hypothetical protein